MPSPVKTATSVDPLPLARYHVHMDAFREFPAGKDDGGRRLDRVARHFLAGIPLSAIHRAIRKGQVRVNGGPAGPDQRILPGDMLQVWSGLVNIQAEAAPSITLPPPSVLCETQDILFVDKPAGLLVHDGTGSLEAMVRAYLAPTQPPSLSFVPGPLHRLDRNTSGVVAFSRTLRGARLFGEAQEKGRIAKVYLALLSGRLETEQTWTDSLVRDTSSHTTLIPVTSENEAGKDARSAREAVTRAFPLASGSRWSLVALNLETGRTHQIRAQAASRNHPLVGDIKYGAEPAMFPYCLHAWFLESESAAQPDLPALVIAPLPIQFSRIIEDMFSLDEKEVYSRLRHFFP